MEMYFHQTFKLQMHDPMESKHLNNVFEPFLSAPFLLLLHHVVLLRVKSSRAHPALRGRSFSIPITQCRVTSDLYPQAADVSAQKKLFAVFPW